ncbi:MAG TPA: orotidine-5'-phosphate decarboxylase [Gammaproteobacteria bacterium]|nr:orotidine-5'-phosphate decarboxylase [Gammaproteobacteria bacterium]
MVHLTYTERAQYCISSLGRRLLELCDEKETNLALSADVTSTEQLLTLANQLGPEICLLKTHIDIIEDFTPYLTLELVKLAHKHRFLIFEDRKFADIGNIVKQQYVGGTYHIADWADIINAHSLPGPGVVKGLAEVGRKKNRGLVLVAEMSSMGHFTSQDYLQHTLKMAEQFSDFVIGFITPCALSSDPHWISMMPGVKLKNGTDALGQQYTTPEKAIIDHRADLIIVGRGILAATDPVEEARRYREQGWKAYQKRCQKVQ